MVDVRAPLPPSPSVPAPMKTSPNSSDLLAPQDERPANDQGQYCYADGTDFPCNVNFLDTLEGAVRVCAAAWSASLGLQHLEAMNPEEDFATTCHQLDSILSTVSTALSTLNAPVQTEHRNVMDAVLAAAVRNADAARATAQARLEKAPRALARRGRSIRTSLLNVVAANLALQDFPGTRTTYEWGADDGRPRIVVSDRNPMGLELARSFSTKDVPLLSEARRIQELAPDLRITILRSEGWLSRRLGAFTRSVQRYRVVRANVNPDRCHLMLRSAGHAPDLQLRVPHAGPVTALMIGEGPSPTTLTGLSAQRVRELAARYAGQIKALTADRRGELIAARLDGTALEDTERPAELAMRITRQVLPLVRELRARSQRRHELAMVRELRAGVREQVYLPLDELFAPVGALPPELRVHFRGLGYVDPATTGDPDSTLVVDNSAKPEGEADQVTEEFGRPLPYLNAPPGPTRFERAAPRSVRTDGPSTMGTAATLQASVVL